MSSSNTNGKEAVETEAIMEATASDVNSSVDPIVTAAITEDKVVSNVSNVSAHLSIIASQLDESNSLKEEGSKCFNESLEQLKKVFEASDNKLETIRNMFSEVGPAVGWSSEL